MQTFTNVTDEYLSRRIDAARTRIVYAAPGVASMTAEALVRALQREDLATTIILDAEEDAYRIGYGDPAALVPLHQAAVHHQFPLRKQAGLRIGLLAIDGEAVIWAPTARSLEPERTAGQPNGVVLGGVAAQALENAVGAEKSNVLPSDAEIGKQALRPEELQSTVARLEENPPEPFDLARKTRVFATRFQYVECEVRGAEWAKRRIKLSSILFNADLPESLQDILDTQVRPFQMAADRTFPVPCLVKGRPAYERDGSRMLEPASQADIEKAWSEIQSRFLYKVKDFGWIIRRDRLDEFRQIVGAYQETLVCWVAAFRKHVSNEEDSLVKSIVNSVTARITRSDHGGKLKGFDVETEVKRGLERLRIIEPRVRIVLKNISWESSRDAEFLQAIERAVPREERAGWFEEFTAARTRTDGRN